MASFRGTFYVSVQRAGVERGPKHHVSPSPSSPQSDSADKALRNGLREQLQLLHVLQTSQRVACSQGHSSLHLASFERAAASSPALLLWRKPSFQYRREARKREGGDSGNQVGREAQSERQPKARPGPRPLGAPNRTIPRRCQGLGL